MIETEEGQRDKDKFSQCLASASGWQERLFGENLIKCDDPPPLTSTTTTTTKTSENINYISTGKVLNRIQTIGVYFSFANVGQDDVALKLIALYKRLNHDLLDNSENESDVKQDGRREDEYEENVAKSFEVVQVVLWAHNDVYTDGDLETTHSDTLKNKPWYAVPFHEIDLKTRLSKRFGIKSGVPTLVLLDSDGTTVSVSAQDRLMDDPMGVSFPWRPRPARLLLKDITLEECGLRHRCADEAQSTRQEFFDSELVGDSGFYQNLDTEAESAVAVRGFYFAAHWCPPCRAFTPQLAAVYHEIKRRCKKNERVESGLGGVSDFEILFVSSDRSYDSYKLSTESMPWLSVPWSESGVRAELAQLYGIRGIPTLLLVDRGGHVITMDGRAEIAEDPLATNFPWKPKPVNLLTERYLNKLHDYPAIVLFIDSESDMDFAEAVLKPAAQRHQRPTAATPSSTCANININKTPKHEDSRGGSENHLHHNHNNHQLLFLIALDSNTNPSQVATNTVVSGSSGGGGGGCGDIEAAELIRELCNLDDVVPLLVVVDIPRRRVATMEYGVEINAYSVAAFLERYWRGDVQFRDVIDQSRNINNVDTTEDDDDEEGDDGERGDENELENVVDTIVDVI